MILLLFMMIIKCKKTKAEVVENDTSLTNVKNNCYFLFDGEEAEDVEVSDARVINVTGNVTYYTNGTKENRTILVFLLSLMALSGMLAIISNVMVILTDLKSRKQIFERPLVSLAWVDVLTGCIGTPLVCCIYYFQCKL